MKKIFRYRKVIGLTVVISLFLLNFPLSPSLAVMISTDSAIDQNSEPFYDRVRVKAFLARTDVLAHLQAYGISYGEALSRVDSLTDREIVAIAGKMDQYTAFAGSYEMDGSPMAIIGLLLYTIFFIIVFYFSRSKVKEELQQPSTVETEEKPESSTMKKEDTLE